MTYTVIISACKEDGGLHTFRFDESGKLCHLDFYPLPLPMYTVTYDGRLYIIERKPFEGNDISGILSAKLEDGKLSDYTAPEPTDGIVACHLTVNENGIYAANYVSGSIKKLGGRLVTRVGCGPNKARQESAHLHQVTAMPDGNIIACDLGNDTVAVYDKDLSALISEAKVPDGDGARHIAVERDGKTIWCLTEMGSTVVKMRYENGKLEALSHFPLYPDREVCDTRAAAIRLSNDEKTLYASNRGFDLITVVDISGETARIVESVSAGGESPRDFILTPDGKFMVVTNENTGVALMKMNGTHPELTDTYKIDGALCATIV